MKQSIGFDEVPPHVIGFARLLEAKTSGMDLPTRQLEGER